MYRCELDVPGRKCPNLLEDGIHCNNNTVCSFCKDETLEEKPKVSYVRKERWYEKYYKKNER